MDRHASVEQARTLGMHAVPTTGLATQDGLMTTRIPESALVAPVEVHAVPAKPTDRAAAARLRWSKTEERR
jgi:hypothetical protein